MLVPDGYTLVVGGSPIEVPSSLLNVLCGSADDVIAVDAGADKLMTAKIAIDCLVGDFDSISREALEYAFSCDPDIEKVPSRKDYTDMTLALRVASRRESHDVILTGVTGGRLDHTLAVLGSCDEAYSLSPLIVDASETVCFLSYRGPRSSVRLSDLGLRPDDEFSVLTLRDGSRVDITGVRYPVQDHELSVLGGLGISNVMESDNACVSCGRGSALVVVSGM